MVLQLQNVEVDFSFYMVDAPLPVDGWLAVAVRSSDGWVGGVGPNEGLPTNGYVLRLGRLGVDYRFRSVNTNTSTELGGSPGTATFGQNDVVRVRLQADGSTIQFKWWIPAAGAEPAGWEESVTNTDHTAAGDIRFGYSKSDNQAPVVRFTEFKVINLDTSATVFTGDWTGTDYTPWPQDVWGTLTESGRDSAAEIIGNEGNIYLDGGSDNNLVAYVRHILPEQEVTDQLAVPTNVTLTAATGVRQITLSWDSVAGANDYEWAVEYLAGSSWFAHATGTTASLSVVRTDADSVDWGTTYRGRVRARPA